MELIYGAVRHGVERGDGIDSWGLAMGGVQHGLGRGDWMVLWGCLMGVCNWIAVMGLIGGVVPWGRATLAGSGRLD